MITLIQKSTCRFGCSLSLSGEEAPNLQYWTGSATAGAAGRKKTRRGRREEKARREWRSRRGVELIAAESITILMLKNWR